jgi:type VI secretion system protein VasD
VLCIGCSSDTTKWRVQLVPTSTINQDDAGAPLPVVARVYQLKGKEKFQQATFKALWKSDKDVLGEDFVDRKEIMVHPEKKTDLYLDLETKHGPVYLGVMVLFRQPDVEGWRQIVEASSSMLNPMTPKVKLILDKNMIKLAD